MIHCKEMVTWKDKHKQRWINYFIPTPIFSTSARHVNSLCRHLLSRLPSGLQKLHSCVFVSYYIHIPTVGTRPPVWHFPPSCSSFWRKTTRPWQFWPCLQLMVLPALTLQSLNSSAVHPPSSTEKQLSSLLPRRALSCLYCDNDSWPKLADYFN